MKYEYSCVYTISDMCLFEPRSFFFFLLKQKAAVGARHNGIKPAWANKADWV